MGIGDWGLGVGPNPQSPIPNPQSPIPNPHLLNKFYKIDYFYLILTIVYLYKKELMESLYKIEEIKNGG